MFAFFLVITSRNKLGMTSSFLRMRLGDEVALTVRENFQLGGGLQLIVRRAADFMRVHDFTPLPIMQ